MKLDVSKEIIFKTARSGGKGGQNVNKVETMVMGHFLVAVSNILSESQKATVHQKLASKINTEGYLMIKSQESRSQLENKQLAIEKMNALIEKALIKPKPRKPTRPSFASKEKRIDSKKITGQIKSFRKKIDRYE